MDDLERLHTKLMQNKQYEVEYEKSRPEFEIMREIIIARSEKNMTQKELAQITGIRQSNISRIENGNCSPNISTLQQIAKGLGKQLHIEFRYNKK